MPINMTRVAIAPPHPSQGKHGFTSVSKSTSLRFMALYKLYDDYKNNFVKFASMLCIIAKASHMKRWKLSLTLLKEGFLKGHCSNTDAQLLKRLLASKNSSAFNLNLTAQGQFFFQNSLWFSLNCKQQPMVLSKLSTRAHGLLLTVKKFIVFS